MPRKKIAAPAPPPAEPPVPPGLVVRRVPLDSLHADPANARTHDARNLRAIADSLAEFRQVEPLVIQAGTGRVIGGNGRLAAMRAAGWTEADVVELDIGDVRAAALGITLNRTAELAGWDDTALAATLRALQSEEADLLAAVGYEPAELDGLLERMAAEMAAGTDGEPRPAEPDGDPDPAPAGPTIAGVTVDDPQGEWAGMPECENGDETPCRSLNVHFATPEDVADFSRLIGQEFSEVAKYIWHPKLKMQRPSATPYANES